MDATEAANSIQRTLNRCPVSSDIQEEWPVRESWISFSLTTNGAKNVTLFENICPVRGDKGFDPCRRTIRSYRWAGPISERGLKITQVDYFFLLTTKDNLLSKRQETKMLCPDKQNFADNKKIILDNINKTQ